MIERSIHCRIDPIPRVSGSGAKRKFNSVARAVDYICREGPYTEAQLARKRNKTEKEERLIAKGHGNIPSWGISKNGSPRKFCATADEYERADGRLGYRFEMAVPRPIYAAGRSEELIDRYIDLHLSGHPYVYALHCPVASDGGPQPHFHLIACERRPELGQVYTREKFFLRANPHYPERGGCAKDRTWHERGFFGKSRKGWADCCNQILIEIGSDVRVTEKSYEDRGIQKLPGIHFGPTVRARAARGDHLTPSPSFLRRAEQQEKLKPLEDELSELKLKQENDMKIETANQHRAQAALNEQAAAAEQTQEIQLKEQDVKIETVNQNFEAEQAAEQEIHMRVLADEAADNQVLAEAEEALQAQTQGIRMRILADESMDDEVRMRLQAQRAERAEQQHQRVFSEQEVDRIRTAIARALAGWDIKWRPTGPCEMPAFSARSGPHRIDFDGHDVVGHDESEDTLSRMVKIAQAAGKRRVEISGSPAAKRRLAELCRDAGIEVVEPIAKKATAPKPMTVEKSAAPTPFDTPPSPFNQ